MYILTKLESRAETTDTLLYYCAKDRATLEEIILSIYEEVLDNAYIYYQYIPNLTASKFKETLNKFIDNFKIVYVPFLED